MSKLSEERYKQLKIAEKGAIVSIIAYVIVSIIKLLVGNLAHSEALSADGLNNFTDIIASVTVLIGLRIARKPADDDHRYGHWKVESVASMITSFIMLMVGFQVLYSAAQTLLSGREEAPDPVAAFVGIGSAIFMMAVYLYNKKLSDKVKSQALMAAAKDNYSDALTSIGTSIAIFASSFHMNWLDSTAAFVIGLLILKTAIDIFRESTFSLSDGFDESSLEEYRKTILAISGVKEVKAIRGRYYGANVFLDVIVLMDSSLTVEKSHKITENIEEILQEKYEVFDIDIHVEPYEKEEA